LSASSSAAWSSSVRSRWIASINAARVLAAERLAARPDAAEIERRHADYYRALAERADRPLRGAGQGEWLEVLEAEAGNLATAVRWHLARDPSPLPHLFRILWPFWSMRDRYGEARPWVDQLLPAAASFDPEARAELEWVAAVTANEVGDDTAALAARRLLAPLLEQIRDPLLHAVCELAMAWTSPITGDFEGALRQASASLQAQPGAGPAEAAVPGGAGPRYDAMAVPQRWLALTGSCRSSSD
jgi:hypothetical protein